MPPSGQSLKTNFICFWEEKVLFTVKKRFWFRVIQLIQVVGARIMGHPVQNVTFLLAIIFLYFCIFRCENRHKLELHFQFFKKWKFRAQSFKKCMLPLRWKCLLEKVYVKNSIFHVQSIYFTCLCSLPEMSPRGRFLAGLINISQVWLLLISFINHVVYLSVARD